MGSGVNLPQNVSTDFDLTFNECGRVFLSETGLIYHETPHPERIHSVYSIAVSHTYAR